MPENLQFLRLGNRRPIKQLRARAFAGLLLTCFTALTSLAAPPRSPFGIQVVASKPGVTNNVLQVQFTVPPDCVLYSERLHFLTEEGDELTPTKIPNPLRELDQASGKEKTVYERSFNAELTLASLVNDRLVVKFQGCSNGACFFPEKRTFALTTNAASLKVFTEIMTPVMVAVSSGSDWAREMHGFKVAAQQSGYLSAKNFLSFLDRAQSGHDNADDPLSRFQQAGLMATWLLIVLGGLLLNLTPCILPMIPINLAIIGAGSAASSRAVGFKNGAVYGAGMALAYGVLGLGVVLTGAKFGAINASVWFNLVIAAVFVVLALGMFDKINIDLSRFSGGIGPQKAAVNQGHFLRHAFIFIMGVMAALLAGACVAPVVISVMLLAANIYSHGNWAGLLLPFLLGAGMALPWPFAGAGLSFLPKPGRWMNRVKHGFGVLIFAFGIYYAHLAVVAYQSYRDATSLAAAPPGAVASQDDANQQLADALRLARLDGRPVLVDFHASWCKNCLAMDETVFKQAEVKKRCRDFVLVRYAAERPGEGPAKEVLDHFGVLGLPAYVVLTSTNH